MDNAELQMNLERYQRESFAWAMSCCLRDPTEAENVLQTVYLKILEGKARFDERSAFKTWLFSVIRKTAADAHRRNFWQNLKLFEYVQNTAQVTPEEHPDEALYQSEMQRSLQRALLALSKRQREVLQLVFYHEFSVSEAAQAMGVSIGSARTHYERGKKQLRKLMAETRGTNEHESARRRNQTIIPRTQTRG